MGILRLLLALAVVFSHALGSHLRELAMPGSLAVQSFYVISGFYMALVLHEKYNFPGSTRIFYLQRYLRLAPLYWVTLGLTLAVYCFYNAISDTHTGKFTVWSEYGGQLSVGALAVLCLTQLTMFGQDGLMFSALAGTPLALQFTADWTTAALPSVRFMFVPPAWSLSVELLFYLVAPFLVRRSVRCQLAIVAATFGLRVLAAKLMGWSSDPWDNRFFPFEAGVFLLGSLGYRCLPKAEAFMQNKHWLRVVLSLALGGIVLFYGAIPIPETIRHWLVLGLIVVCVPLLFAVTKRDHLDRWIGELSYPLYLLHQIVIFACEPILRRIPTSTYDVGIIVLPLLATVIVYQLLERPIDAWRGRFFERQHDSLRAKKR